MYTGTYIPVFINIWCFSGFCCCVKGGSNSGVEAGSGGVGAGSGGVTAGSSGVAAGSDGVAGPQPVLLL